ncbi:chlorophyll synthase, chloroplastic-like isoform X2 [Brassica napus]|uniref:chlorophyll synthase, chloroplastic-like isoform X1 n=1 Tax=Brassica napus TaxID=3708 RepID=UPI0006AB51DC|nr:chlorophyll synthase, chloroplastic-like isoform X1 [Brassica napus]XP_048595178.1 chlorophyll synthase, chloroplastic-like isoform X2 [Brassica napus]
MSCAFLCHRLIMLVLCLVVGALRDSSQSGALGASRGSGHTTPALFYLALGGSLLSYIYSAPPLKLGIAIVYNFKSVEGDRAMGLQSLLVAFGTEAAKWICVSAIDVTQISVAGM